jgi:hypothetical protein
VLTYDRRGNSRSRLHGEPRPLSLAEQSADAIAVLGANGFPAALVFGNSGAPRSRLTWPRTTPRR